MYDCTAMLGVAGLSAGVSAARAVGEGFCVEKGFAGLSVGSLRVSLDVFTWTKPGGAELSFPRQG